MRRSRKPVWPPGHRGFESPPLRFFSALSATIINIHTRTRWLTALCLCGCLVRGNDMDIRRYQQGEEADIWSVYFDTTRTIVAADYTDEQVRRWAPDTIDTAAWERKLAATNSFVAVIEGRIVGFAELEPSGYIDNFYCHHLFQRKSIGTRPLDAVEEEARRVGLQRLFAETGTTGIGFFTASGFVIREERINTVCDAPAKQYVIDKCLLK